MPPAGYGMDMATAAAAAAAAAGAAAQQQPGGPYSRPHSHSYGAMGYGGSAHGGMSYHPSLYGSSYSNGSMPGMGPSHSMQMGGGVTWSGDCGDYYDDDGTRAVKRARLVWTPQLHRKFETAVAKLGEDRAVPKNIMQVCLFFLCMPARCPRQQLQMNLSFGFCMHDDNILLDLVLCQHKMYKS